MDTTSNPLTVGESNPNMVSGMQLLMALTGDEWVEVVKRTIDGKYKNYRVFASKLRTGKSVYDTAVENGFIGSVEQFLETLVGASAYKTAVNHGVFVGTEEQWLACTRALYTLDVENAGKVFTADENGQGIWATIDLSLIGLDKVDNTEDMEKPVSNPQKDALHKKVSKSEMTTEVMKVMLAMGFQISDDGNDIILDEGVVVV